MTKRKIKRVVGEKKGSTSATAHKRTSGPRPTSWQGALERNLRTEGYSAREASELVEIAAS
jgi:hypothetical protein